MFGVTSYERDFALAVNAVPNVLLDDGVDKLAQGLVFETELARRLHEVKFVPEPSSPFWFGTMFV